MTGPGSPPNLEPSSSFILFVLLRFGVNRMPKVLYCNDLVPGCKFEARGNSEEEVLAEIADHISIAHHMVNLSDEILAMISQATQEDIRVRGARA